MGTEGVDWVKERERVERVEAYLTTMVERKLGRDCVKRDGDEGLSQRETMVPAEQKQCMAVSVETAAMRCLKEKKQWRRWR